MHTSVLLGGLDQQINFSNIIKKIIDRCGFLLQIDQVSLRPDSHWFLEQFIPFDMPVYNRKIWGLHRTI